ncbi:unnamed protein product [Echinostoma caproni]|uniref:3-hydroxyisobutyryl-CoA hydrolase, mitochondrial n=1 Tax=Echinostoma caproni TaxID=27848 RepID=A0A183AJ26_9TREM|nr:unnamed protein product [Echinostoma caproni]
MRFHGLRRITLTKLVSLSKRCSSSGENSAILAEFKSCGIITLNRPKLHNSLDLHMIRQIYPQLKEWNENPAVRISHIIIEGAGNRSFCAGGDVRAVVEAAQIGDKTSELFFREEYRLNYLIGILQKPYIALLDGITMGGGVGLSVHGRFRVVTEKTLFAMPETAIGLFPDVGGGFFLPRLPCPGLGPFLALTGHRLQGLEVLWAGVATHYKPTAEVNLVGFLLVFICPKPRSTIRIFHKAKHSFQCSMLMQNRSPLPALMIPIIAFVLSGLYMNVSVSNIPIYIQVTLRQLQLGSALSFVDNFKMEFRLSQRFVRGHDFPEGVRAVLVDKDKKPKWIPNSLDQVTLDTVDRYFEPLTDIPEWDDLKWITVL